MLKPAWCSLPNEANAIIPIPKNAGGGAGGDGRSDLGERCDGRLRPVGSGRQFLPIPRDQKQRVIDTDAVGKNHRIDVDSLEETDASRSGAERQQTQEDVEADV